MRLETLAVHYADDVDRVHMILMGENVFGADTKVIDKIQELESEAMLTLVHDAYPYEFSYSVDFTRCKRIPDLLCPDFNSMKHMALRVPEGMVDAYASHPVWCMAAYITDKVSCVDQCVRPGVAAKKNKMKYAMAKAAVDAMAYSNLQVHPAFSEDNVNFEIEQPLDLGKVWNATVCITGRTMPCSDIDCWEKLCGRLGELKRFISGEIDELP